MTPKKDGCVTPATGPMATSPEPDETRTPSGSQEVQKMQARVGHEAPDFEATAYIPDSGDFQPVKLSDYKGKWITLCFYPGDFTFV